MSSRRRLRRPQAAVVGLAVAVVFMVAAFAIPRLTHWTVNADAYPPLHAMWDPRLGPGTVPAIGLAVLGVLFAGRVAKRLRWGPLLLVVFAYGVAWMVALATVDGRAGIANILGKPHEYLRTARSVTDLFATLREYVSRIPLHSPHNWPVHIAGHPPGALMFFVLLVHLGLGGGFAAGCVVIVLAATTPVAVLITLRRLGAEGSARSAAPFLVLGPAAIWMAVSADAMFGAAAAWGLCCLALASTATRRGATAAWGVLSGLVLGYCLFLSYGLPLLVILATAVLIIARTWRPIPWAIAGVGLVVLCFSGAGFLWWDAYPVLSKRYYAGIAAIRPYSYWVWGDLAALGFSAGPIVGASIGMAFSRLRGIRRAASAQTAVTVLTLAALTIILLASLSGMSKAEVERIWLPFVPWLLVSTAHLPERWVRIAVAVQVILALLIQHLLSTVW